MKLSCAVLPSCMNPLTTPISNAYWTSLSYSLFVTLREKDPSLPLLPDNAAYTIHVGEPIFPDPALSVRENAGAMREKNAAFTRAVYEETYGKPLCYLCEEEK